MKIIVSNKDDYDAAGCVLFNPSYEISDGHVFFTGLSIIEVEALSRTLAGSRSNLNPYDLTVKNATKNRLSTKNFYNYTFKITSNIKVEIDGE